MKISTSIATLAALATTQVAFAETEEHYNLLTLPSYVYTIKTSYDAAAATTFMKVEASADSKSPYMTAYVFNFKSLEVREACSKAFHLAFTSTQTSFFRS